MAAPDEFQDVLVQDQSGDKDKDDRITADTDVKEEVIEVDQNTSTPQKNKNKTSNTNDTDRASPNLIRPQRTSSHRVLRIVSTEERKGRVAKHTVYIIECDPSPPGVITVARRYNDFKWLRNTLSMQFPGLFVPPLPPANVIGRFENSFIEERRQDLERFLNRLECIGAFAESLAFGMFLSRPETTFFEGRKEVEEAIYARNEDDITVYLCSLFPDLSSSSLDESVHDTDVLKLKEYLMKIDVQMTELNKSAIRLFKHLNFVSSEMLLFEEAFDGLYSAESNYPYKATAERLDVGEQLKLWASYQTAQTDTYYDNLFRCLRYEHQDIKALLELFKYHDDLYHKKYKKVCKSIEKWNEMETNGVTLKPGQERQKTNDFDERKQVFALLNIVTKIILKNEVILIWNTKTKAWREKIQKFTKIQTQITNKMLNNWKSIAVNDENDNQDDNH